MIRFESLYRTFYKTHELFLIIYSFIANLTFESFYIKMLKIKMYAIKKQL